MSSLAKIRQAQGLSTTDNQSKPSILATFGSRYDLDADKVLGIIRSTVMRPGKDEPEATNEEVAAFLIICNQHELNPFTKEIFGFRSKGKMLYVISLDGWSTILNRQPALNGIEFEEHFDDGDKVYAITCKIHRKDRALPTVITEYRSECYRDTEPWRKWPIRMLRHKAMIQCSRIAFGLSGIMDEDEAQRINPTFSSEFDGTPVIEQQSREVRKPSDQPRMMEGDNSKEQITVIPEKETKPEVETVERKQNQPQESTSSKTVDGEGKSSFSFKF